MRKLIISLLGFIIEALFDGKKAIKLIIIVVSFYLSLIGVILLVGYLGDYYRNKKIEETNEINQKELLSYIKMASEDELIDDGFLNYVIDNYKISSLYKVKDTIMNEGYSNSVWRLATGMSYRVLLDLYHKKYDSMDNVKIFENYHSSSIGFVGDISLADNFEIMPKYDERGEGIYGILSKETVNIMNNMGIMVANNEFTVSDRGEPLYGKLYTFRASPSRLAIYNDMGIDLVTLANNHVYDYGEDAFNDMLDYLDEYDMPHIGAGKNIQDAMKPYYFILNGYKIAFVNATRAEKYIMTPEATNESGGVFRCYDSTAMQELISEVKKNSDYVIALIHFGKEDSHELEEEQVASSKLYIDAGADMVIGSHAHVLQGIEFYNHKPIVYNLGDFIFNDESKDTGIFKVNLYDNGKMDYYFIPAYQSNEYTEILDGEEKQRVINDLNSWSINAFIDKYGRIEEKAN